VCCEEGVKIGEEEWYDEAIRSRGGWQAICRRRQMAAVRDIVCNVYVMCVAGNSGEKVTKRDTSVWRREGKQ